MSCHAYVNTHAFMHNQGVISTFVCMYVQNVDA